ncbi:fungal-specific transcription factor domain-containing protein [Aspergillus novoparasiticus]|uniref:Fungal-specific transcription factor domain-containing protein n=1 Tax=Aspergillus novoparasiticus TaxID=986946 RepID=A0A5N6EX35_9EURO|nr:fungal-specific transcription factor domain-containing protein [Aspergillus novoparasiticus]
MFSAEPPLKRRRVSSTASQHPLPAEEERSPGANEITHPNPIDYHESQPLPPQSYNGISHSSPASGGPFQSPGSWYQDGFSQDPGFLASQEELRCILFSLAYSAAPTRAPSPDAGILDRLGDRGTDRLGIDMVPQSHRERQREESHRSPFSNSKRIKYLKNYVTEVAPWLDMFDSQCTFRQQLPALARTFPALSYAILAFSARHMERKEGVQDLFDSLELYQEAIRLLSPVLQVRDPKIVAACVLLCCLEMMSARAQDWRRHLEGCAALFDAFEIHGFSNGLLQAVFWCYARMDLCGALISDGTQTTLLHPSKWLPPGYQEEDAYQLFQDAKSPDMHANYAVYLCMRATQLVSDRTKFVELHEQNGCNLETFCLRWVRLWDELQRWFSERPSELLPVQTVNRKPFPHILFVQWAAISSNQLYHTACLLLLKMMPKGIRLPRSPSLSMLWHARRICGISLANPHQGCLNNALQPLWIAGRWFSHASEHKEITKLIRDIEAETGWGTCWRIRDLDIAWGYSTRRRTSNDHDQQFSTAREPPRV